MPLSVEPQSDLDLTPDGADEPVAGWRDALTIMRVPATPGPATPIFNPDSVAAALLADGRVVWASATFQTLAVEATLDPDKAARAREGRAALTDVVETAGEDGAGSAALLVYAPAAATAAWRLPPDLREAMERWPAAVVVLSSQAASRSRPFEDACRAYGLNGLQTRVLAEIVRTGAVRPAAEAADVTFHTARKAVAHAMQRTRTTRLAALVSHLMSLTFGVLPDDDPAEVLRDAWGLTPRQAALAGLMAAGATREAAASTLSISLAVARKELETVYLVLGVSTGVELARMTVEAHAFRWLIAATGGDVGFLDTREEPVRFVHRPDGGRVAFSDYGPPTGQPVLVAHSTITSRIVARVLLRALQTAGYRPIAIDRPGFGLTDELAGARPGAHDPFAAAAPDALLVLDALKIRRTDVVARGAAQFVVALGRIAPSRIGRVVLVNPDPPRQEGGGRGPMAAGKDIFMRSPALIRLLAPLLIRNVTFESVFERVRRDAVSSPADTAALHDPAFMRDYFRALRSFATGRYAGWINETTELFHGRGLAPLPATTAWQVLVGTDDYMHEPARVVTYWRRMLPDADVRLTPGAGRFLAYTHPDAVVEALRADA